MLLHILDNDLYKFTMQQAVLELYSRTNVRYKFHLRSKVKFNKQFFAALEKAVDSMKDVKSCSYYDCQFLKTATPFLKDSYIEWLKNYTFDPKNVKLEYANENIYITISGLWSQTILWEVPLLAIISELYYIHCDTNWTMDGQEEQAEAKAAALEAAGCKWSDLGTRRRRNFDTQYLVANIMANHKGFAGTSNVYIAKTLNIAPIGTVAHEWIMGISAHTGIKQANKVAMEQWQQVYNGALGIALPDTFTTNAFLKDFNPTLARLYDGVRQDSGNPSEFVYKMIQKYTQLHIDPRQKTILFSDSLDVEKSIELQRTFEHMVKPLFGIGTNFTNDFAGSPALSMVIKLDSVWVADDTFSTPVVKIGDGGGKTVGDGDALRVAYWTLWNTPLDHDNESFR